MAKLVESRKKYLEQHPVIREAKQRLSALEMQIGERIQILGNRSFAGPRFAVPRRSDQKPRTKAEREALLKQLTNLSGKEQWSVLAAVRDDPILSGLIAKRNAQEESLFNLRKDMGTKHPAVLQQEEVMRHLDEQLVSNSRAMLKGMEIEFPAMDEAAPKHFSVLGGVNSPGFIKVPTGKEQVGLLDAVAMAGGFTKYARTTEIKVRRLDGDQERIYEINAKKLSEDPKFPPFFIKAGDRITVPERIF